MEPFDCPLYDRCSSNICPVDSKWMKRSYDSSDQLCRIMSEMAKPGADERFRKKSDSDEYEPRKIIWLSIMGEVEKTQREIFAKFPDIRERVEEAAKTGSMFDRNAASGERLKKWREERE